MGTESYGSTPVRRVISSSQSLKSSEPGSFFSVLDPGGDAFALNLACAKFPPRHGLSGADTIT